MMNAIIKTIHFNALFFHQVNGERNPDEVYKDFRAAVLQILGATEDQSTMNGVSGVGVGAGGIPGEIVGVEPAPAVDIERERREENVAPVVPLPVAMPLPVPKALPAAVPIKQVANDRVVTPKVSVILVLVLR